MTFQRSTTKLGKIAPSHLIIFKGYCGEWVHLNGCHTKCDNVVMEIRHEKAGVLPLWKHPLAEPTVSTRPGLIIKILLMYMYNMHRWDFALWLFYSDHMEVLWAAQEDITVIIKMSFPSVSFASQHRASKTFFCYTWLVTIFFTSYLFFSTSCHLAHEVT